MSVRKSNKRDGSLNQALFIVELVCLIFAAKTLLGNSPVSFDLAPAAVGRPIESSEMHASKLPKGFEAIEVALSISTLVDPSENGTIGQLLYRVCSHQGRSTVVDYSPKTELSNAYEGPVEVTLSDEDSNRAGLKLTVAHDLLAKGDIGADSENKNCRSTKFRRQAVQDSVVTSGTIDQSRGVYFKLSSSFDRTLEGEKTFSIVLQLPIGWQTELLEVSLKAWGSSHQRDPLAEATFPVAVWRAGDEQARRAALSMSDALMNLQQCAVKYDRVIRQRAYPNVFHRIGAALEVVEPKISNDWLTKVMFANVDAYHDPVISKMPVDVRVAILDFQEARGNILAISSNEVQ